MPVIDTELLIKELKALGNYEAIVKEVNELKAQSFTNTIAWTRELTDVMDVTTESIVGVLDKLELSIESDEVKNVIKDFLDDLFDLPFWAEAFDDVIISAVIDFIFEKLKKDPE